MKLNLPPNVAANTPWDEFARRLVTASGSTLENGAANFFVLHQDPPDLAETVSVAFLGMSINCAKCHNHPLEKWTNDQYYGMANLFARVRGKGWGGDFRNGDGNRVVFTVDRGELIQPRTGRPQPPTPLDGEPLPFEATEDRRIHLAKWLVSPENPYFSRAIVNRVWANFFGVGIVEAVDDMRLTNPPSNAALLTELAEVLVESGAGLGSGLSDEEYARAGGEIVAGPESIWRRADLVVKVKEPQPQELARIRSGQVLFTYFHFAASRELTDAFVKTGAVAVAYETITDAQGRLPLLTPMSEVAGRMSVQVGAASLQKANGGIGVLLGGVPGTALAKVVVLGGGVSGTAAAEIAVGMRADVTVVDRSLKRLRQLDALFEGRLKTMASTAEAIESLVVQADLVVGAVLVAGAAAPNAFPAITRPRTPSCSKRGKLDPGWCEKAGAVSSAPSGSATQVWIPCSGGPAGRSSAGVRSECTMPRPATIQLTSPGRMICVEPRLSRCSSAPSNR